MILRIRHETAYKFSEPVPYGLFEIRKTPSTNSAQFVKNWSVDISGGIVEARFNDCHRNAVDLVSVNKSGRSLGIIASGIVDTFDAYGIIGPDESKMPPAYYLRETRLTLASVGVRKMASEMGMPSASSVASMHDLTNFVRESIAYETGITNAESTAEEAIDAGVGVCQDHAHIFLSIARVFGIPARYVSGYLLIQDKFEQAASHAWAEAFLEGIGWTGFDVANGTSPDERYVRLATGLDYRDAAPVRGIRSGSGTSKISIKMRVENVGA